MTNQLSLIVAAEAAKAVTMPTEEWLSRNPFPVYSEIKLDGTRVWLIKTGSKVVMATKHNGIYTQKELPWLTLNQPGIPERLILDCEFVKKGTTSVWVFDVINNGSDCKALPLIERKKLLDSIAFSGNYIKRVEHRIHHDIQSIVSFKDEVIASGLEGIMLKNPNSTYAESSAWLKLKRSDTVDAFVTGRDVSHEGPTYYISCYSKAGEQVDLGKVGSFVKAVNHTDIKNGTVLEIQFQEVTKDKRLRHPFAIRIRDDKTPKECVEEL